MADEPNLKRPRIVFELPSSAPPSADAKKQPGDGDVDSKMQLIQAKIDALNDEFSDEVLAIEQKYSQKRRPLYAERNRHLSQFPLFWSTTLQHHPAVGSTLDVEDLEILKYCSELMVEDNEDIKTGYSIRFKFSENPYFTNSELVKTINFVEGSQLQITSTAPLWNEGFAPVTEEEAQENPHLAIRQYNFFSVWFDGDEVFTNEQDPIAEAIKDEIWTDPIAFYSAESLGPPEVGEDFVEGEGDEEDGMEDGEDFDEGDEEVEDDDEEIEA